MSRRGGRESGGLTLAAIARGLQQQQNLVVVEVLQGIDVVEDVGSEEALGRVSRRRDALGDAGQGGRLQAAARALEGAGLGRGVRVELRLVGVHVIESRASRPVACRRWGSRAGAGVVASKGRRRRLAFVRIAGWCKLGS